jgi:tripartite-type tricarboxylate transporter receptor subunit TctC
LKKLQPGFTMQYIPYSAMAQAVRDLMSGDLHMTVTLVTRNLVELHEAGKIKLLSVSAPRRIGIAPNIPTSIEAGIPNMIAGQFFYLFAPAGTPVPIVQKLNDLSRTALTDATFKAKLESAGFDPHFAGGLEETRIFYEAERALWVPLAEASGEKTN